MYLDGIEFLGNVPLVSVGLSVSDFVLVLPKILGNF